MDILTHRIVGKVAMPKSRVTIDKTQQDESLTIAITGALDLHLTDAFRHAYESQEQRFKHYRIDLRNCTRITSTGLGMLLILKDFLELPADRITLVNSSEDIQHMLDIAGFSKLFVIQ